MPPGLREQRKQRTRDAISAVATELFASRGFDRVTITQVAAAAGVAKMTVTNYFPRKEDLAFDQADAVIGQLAAAVTGRSPGESYLAAIRRAFLAELARDDGTTGLSSGGFAAMVRDSPALTARAAEIAALREQALGDAIAAAEGTDSPEIRLLAAQLAAGYRVLSYEATRRSLAREPRPRIRAELEQAAGRVFAVLDACIGSWGASGC